MPDFEFDDEEDRNARKGRWAPGGSGARFKALVDFDRGPFHYAEGLSYTADSDALDDLLDEWLEEGLVAVDHGGQMETQPAIAVGNGTVENGDD